MKKLIVLGCAAFALAGCDRGGTGDRWDTDTGVGTDTNLYDRAPATQPGMEPQPQLEPQPVEPAPPPGTGGTADPGTGGTAPQNP
jgi:hypothetical protein